MCHLHDQGRDHIWAATPEILPVPFRWRNGKPGGHDHRQSTMARLQPHELGNAGYLPSDEQRRGLWAGAELAPHQDLSALFVVLACELYLRKGGRFAMVLPNAALDREQYEGFRGGVFTDELGTLTLAFGESWDLRRLRPHFFPRACCVAFGSRVEPDVGPRAMPANVQKWTGRLESKNAHWSSVCGWVTRNEGEVQQTGSSALSPYHPMFTQGATIQPMLAFFVTERRTSALGISRGRIGVQSYRSANEKKPWKNLPPLSGVIESRFVKHVYTGESVLPFRIEAPMNAVIPYEDQTILRPDQIELHPGLQRWWRKRPGSGKRIVQVSGFL